MKTYKLGCTVMERYKKSGDLLIDIDDDTEGEKLAIIKESTFEINDPDGDTLDDVDELTSVYGYVHAQIVDENADSLLLNLTHPYTGEDNLFRVKKEESDEEAEILKEEVIIDNYFVTEAAAAGAKARDSAIDKMLAEQKSRFLSACARTQRKEGENK